MKYFALLYIYVNLTGGDVQSKEHTAKFTSLSACTQYMNLVSTGAFYLPELEGYRNHGMICFDTRQRDNADAEPTAE